MILYNVYKLKFPEELNVNSLKTFPIFFFSLTSPFAQTKALVFNDISWIGANWVKEELI